RRGGRSRTDSGRTQDMGSTDTRDGSRRPADLPAEWRDRAVLFEEHGQGGAVLLRYVADELEQAIREHELELLTLDEAERESGYTRSALEKQIARREIPNAGRKGSPRIRRCDLPKKPGSVVPVEADGPDIVTDLLAQRAARR
ncbi:MAG: hypothetical protein RQ751_14325, partial [Longimicrobiales bacterium]|nr:hypothetical protein [Longimicrobiales bacterium]